MQDDLAWKQLSEGMLIDSHAHLDSALFADDLPEVMARAKAAGVTETIAMGMTVETSAAALRVAHAYPNVRACVGIHPMEADGAPEDVIDRLRDLARDPRVVAIGEIGLDYHAIDPDAARETAKRVTQARVFRDQLALAVELGLNANLHMRDEYDPALWSDALAILAPFAGKLRVCCHCFKSGPEKVGWLAERGHLVSFTGFVTYPEYPQIGKTAAVVAPGTFMLETDCPAMHPAPLQDRRCEPAQLRLVGELIAELRGEPLEDLAAHTMATAHAFYKFDRAA